MVFLLLQIMIKITFAAAFLYRRVASWIRSRTSSSPFPHGTTTRTFPKQTVTFMAFGYVSLFYLGCGKKKFGVFFRCFWRFMNDVMNQRDTFTLLQKMSMRKIVVRLVITLLTNSSSFVRIRQSFRSTWTE